MSVTVADTLFDTVPFEDDDHIPAAVAVAVPLPARLEARPKPENPRKAIRNRPRNLP